ncbi:MAG: nucleotide-binding universal stress UspA family protein [Planctomycetaceae bacterium]|jgi:nucleotide-binding universal stress UspA family protein
MSWLPKKTILVPVDFSDPSVEAIRTALELVNDPASVHVLHVLDEIEHTAPAVLFGEFDEPARKQRAGEFLSEFLKRHELTGLTELVQVGNPGIVISDYAKQSGAELVVMPSHGHHGLRRILLGSVAERVLRHAECPVLVLRRADKD